MKRIKNYIILTAGFISYFIIGHFTKIYIPCIFHKITKLWCPGCGITRMFISLFKGQIKNAFYYNQLVFISLPIYIILIVDAFISKFKDKKPIYKKIPNYIYYIYLVLLIIFMILRNIFPYFAPHSI